MNNIIESLLEEREQKIRLAKEAEKEAQTKEVDSLLASLKEFLGGFFPLLEERKIGYSLYRDGKLYIRIQVPALDDLRLAPFEIHWGEYSRHNGYTARGQIFRFRATRTGDLVEALAMARENYEEYKDDLRKKKIEEFEKALNWKKTPVDFSPESAREVLAAHLAEFPDREEEATKTLDRWEKARADYLSRKERERREEEEREAERALRKTLYLGYLQDLASWMTVREALLKRNETLAEAIQAVSDSRPYTVYCLEYAYLAREEYDGEEYRDISVRRVYTLQEEPDESGYWIVEGKDNPVRIYHPGTLEKMVFVPSRGIMSKTIERGGVTLHFAPNVRDEKIEEIVSEIVELPEEPAPPSGLELQYTNDVYYHARKLLRGEDPDLEFYSF